MIHPAVAVLALTLPPSSRVVLGSMVLVPKPTAACPAKREDTGKGYLIGYPHLHGSCFEDGRSWSWGCLANVPDCGWLFGVLEAVAGSQN